MSALSLYFVFLVKARKCCSMGTLYALPGTHEEASGRTLYSQTNDRECSGILKRNEMVAAAVNKLNGRYKSHTTEVLIDQF